MSMFFPAAFKSLGSIFLPILKTALGSILGSVASSIITR